MRNICSYKYNQFKQLNVIAINIKDLINFINSVYTDKTSIVFHGDYNFIDIFNINDIIDLSLKCKDDENLCDFLELLYAVDIKCLCKDQRSMIKYIKYLSSYIYDNNLDSISPTMLADVFSDQFDSLKMTHKDLDIGPLSFLGNYLNYIINFNKQIYTQNYFYNIINIPRDPSYVYGAGQSMDFTFTINHEHKDYHYNLFNIHPTFNLS